LLCEVRTFLGVLRQRGDPGDSSGVKNRVNNYLREIIFPQEQQSRVQRERVRLGPS